MSDLYTAVAALKHGYEVEQFSMYDDKMIQHAETLSGYHDEIINALAQAAALDELMLSLAKNLGPDLVASVNQKVREHRDIILGHAPSANTPKI